MLGEIKGLKKYLLTKETAKLFRLRPTGNLGEISFLPVIQYYGMATVRGHVSSHLLPGDFKWPKTW